MSPKEKLLELLNDWDEERIKVDSYDHDFLESFESYKDAVTNGIPHLTPRQESHIERMYSKYIEGE